MRGKFLDPVSNAKTVGFICALIGLVELLSVDGYPNTLIRGILYMVIGYGLRVSKLWAIYAVGLAVLIDVAEKLNLINQGYQLTQGMVVGLLIYIGFFFWLWQARDRFKK